MRNKSLTYYWRPRAKNKIKSSFIWFFYLKKGKKEKKFHVEQSWLNENGSHLEVGRRKKTK
tara:strand:- start:316 stop:498 length:183 start_codon:yes stop_codon:yes gene_type:complete